MTNKVQTISENTKGTATRAVLLLTAIVAALMLSSGMALAITKTCEDSLATRLGLIRHAPQAIKLDKGWTRGVPDRWPAVGEYLRQRTGHSFPVLSHLSTAGPFAPSPP